MGGAKRQGANPDPNPNLEDYANMPKYEQEVSTLQLCLLRIFLCLPPIHPAG